MPNEPGVNTINQSSGTKLIRIDNRITQSDQIAFNRFIFGRELKPTLDLPLDVLRYMLVPPATLHYAQRPENVNVIVNQKYQEGFHALIVDHRDKPLNTMEELTKFYTAKAEKRARDKALAQAENRRYFSFDLEPPPNLDEFLARNEDLVTQGFLTNYDYVIHYVHLHNMMNGQLRVERFDDRKELRGKGIATAFYERLRLAAKALGFRYVTGGNDSGNISFFIDKLGRIPLSEIPREQQSHFCHEQEGINPDLFTIDFLYPEDRIKFMPESSPLV